MKLNKIKTLIEFNKTKTSGKTILYGCYPHIVKDKLYWQSRTNTKNSIEYAIIDNCRKLVDVPAKNETLANSLACQNFRVFYDTNPSCDKDKKWKAIGGYHVGRASIKNYSPSFDLMNSPLHQELKDCKLSKFLSVIPVQDVVWPNETRLLFEDDFFHPKHANGFYIFSSADGINWETYSEKPILSALTVCKDGMNLGSDNLPSIFYDPNLNEYTAYLRCNIRLGVRNVLMTSSKDLKSWTKPKLIQKNPKFDSTCENLYFFDAYYNQTLGTYIGFAPHFKNKILKKDGSQRKYYDAKTLIMASSDKIHWRIIDTIFNESSSGHLTQRHVIAFEEGDESYYIYSHENFMTGRNKIVKYGIDKHELENLL